ncbi:hypothetical protein [Granulicoccus sp. GXG6511]|uniref:hypothetical protein n=1 Tax=Granulicoccus sp. GXG6511 TaxID=3381351 RepID=UPI003D7E56AB
MTAEQVTVVTDEGNRYPGWVVLPDVVLVRALRRVDFCPTVRVERGGQVFPVADRVDSVAGTPAGRRGVALVLAEGSIGVTGASACPPGVEATEADWRRQFAGH